MTNTGPSMIIRARRLLAVKRKLKDADPESATVTQIAMEYRFTRLGRFAGDLRILATNRYGQ